MGSRNITLCRNCGAVLTIGTEVCASCGMQLTAGARSFRRRWLLPATIAVVVAVGCGVALTLHLGASSTEILLAMIDGAGKHDLHVLDLGDEPTEGTRVLEAVDGFENINLTGDVAITFRYPSVPALHVKGHWIVRFYTDTEDNVTVASVDRDGSEELFSSDTRSTHLVWDETSSSLQLARDDGQSATECLVSNGSDPAEPVRLSDACYWNAGGVLVSFENTGLALDLVVERPDGASYSQQVDNPLGYAPVSYDGRYAAIGMTEPDLRCRIEFYNLETGEKVADTGTHDNREGANAVGTSRLFATVSDNPGHYALYIFDPAQDDLFVIDDGNWLWDTGGGTAYVETAQDGLAAWPR